MPSWWVRGRHHPGTLRLKTLYGVPSGSTVENWPISYDDLEPYYEKAEYDLGVCGERGPYGPRRQKDYPISPLCFRECKLGSERGGPDRGDDPQPDNTNQYYICSLSAPICSPIRKCTLACNNLGY